MWLDKWTPSKFLCKYSLKCGAKVVGIIMLITMINSIIGTAVQLAYMNSCKDCTSHTSYASYGYSITAVIYCFAMLIITIWFLCGIKKKKSSVVLAYAVIGTMWLVLHTCFIIVLLCLYSKEVNLILWIIALICAILFVALLCYGFLVVYGYGKQMKMSYIGSAMGS